jgi:hypothetical protein
MRFCADHCCGKKLVQRSDESDPHFKKRIYCNKRCAGNHSAAKGNCLKARKTIYPSQIEGAINAVT